MSNPEIKIDQGGTGNTQNNTFNHNPIIEAAKQVGSLINLPNNNVTCFAGRDDDLVKLHELLQKNKGLAVSAFVKGMGGVGKSELALQYAKRHQDEYSGGICWLQGNEGTLTSQLQDFVQVQLEEKMPDGLDSDKNLALHCWRRLLERVRGKMLVVLDDVKDYANVEPFLPPQNGMFLVLATTRSELGNAMQQYTLDVLVLAAAVDLLKSFLPEADLRRQNDAEIEKLCEWLGRLPLALELVGRYLALPNQKDTSIANLVKRLEKECMAQLAKLPEEEKLLSEKLKVEASFYLSWKELSPLAQRLACLLALFPLAPIPWKMVENAVLPRYKNEKIHKLVGIIIPKDLEKAEEFINGFIPKVSTEDLRSARRELLNTNLLRINSEKDKDSKDLNDITLYKIHQLLREYFKYQFKRNRKWSYIEIQAIYTLIHSCINLSDHRRDNVFLLLQPHLEMLKEQIPNILDSDIKKYKIEFIEHLLRGLDSLREYYKSLNLYSSAVYFGTNSLKIREKFCNDKHLDIAKNLESLGSIFYTLTLRR